ncbi:hypothetical protein NFI96_000520 [Prochilodus magdalenae]|nr:hypothetical protein NFI96_000520 [Prochilodus magdalenae]
MGRSQELREFQRGTVIGCNKSSLTSLGLAVPGERYLSDCTVPSVSYTHPTWQMMGVNASTPTQSRYRTIVQRGSGGGQECPDTLFEERECEALPVCPSYRWRTHKWHPCTLVPDSVRQGMAGAGESCGRGLEVRGLGLGLAAGGLRPGGYRRECCTDTAGLHPAPETQSKDVRSGELELLNRPRHLQNRVLLPRCWASRLHLQTKHPYSSVTFPSSPVSVSV